ncbi:MAG: fumarylacetoacetate hydrolase family protein [Acidimicrobiales bacterium]
MTFRLVNIDERAALIDDDNYFDLATISAGAIGPDPMQAISNYDKLHELSANLSSFQPTGALEDVELGPPVPRPRNSFAVGLNYQSHVDEASMERPAVPLVFTKFPSCIVGPTAAIELRCETADYEAELVVVIGASGRDIAAADAWNHVAGVTVGQDISDRHLQFAAKPPHFDMGKSRDTYGPIGPILVSPDGLVDRDDLSITCEVNGERRQTGSSGQLIFDVPALIEYISGITTLAPGDIIFTGTPEGVGATQGKFLAPGDVITTTIDGIGTLTNTCR